MFLFRFRQQLWRTYDWEWRRRGSVPASPAQAADHLARSGLPCQAGRVPHPALSGGQSRQICPRLEAGHEGAHRGDTPRQKRRQVRTRHWPLASSSPSEILCPF